MNVLEAGRVVLDSANERLTLDGQLVLLRSKPLRLLRELMVRAGQLVTKEDLIESVWEGRPHSDAVLTTAIKEIRQALGDNPREPWAVETVHGRGYRFLLPVTDRPAAKPDTHSPSPAISLASRRPLRWVLGFVIAGLVVAGSYFLFERSAANAVRSVAVLAFDDMTSDGDQRWFADGLAEELLNSLVRIDGLQVAARTSTQRFAGADIDIREIGKILGVSHVIEGSVRTADNGKIRLTVQLIRTCDGFHQWSSTWDRNLSMASALDIQKDVSERVVDLMQGRPSSPQQTMQVDSLSDAAWELLLRGRQLVERRSAEGINTGISLLHEAVEMAPANATVHAALASAYLFAGDAMQRPLDEAITMAGRHAERALELDPESVEALVASSFLALARRDPGTALAYADAAVAISPGHARAQQRRGVVLSILGLKEEAYAALNVARRLDPLAPVVLANYSQIAMFTGRVDEAFEVARDNLRWNPLNHTARYIMGSLSLQAGQYERAHVCLRTALEASPQQPLIAGRLGELYWRIGADERAVQVAAGPSGWAPRAAVLLGRGEIERALAESGDVQSRGLNGITPLDIHYWAGDMDAAAVWANQFVDSIGDIDRLASAAVLPDDTVTALAVLEATGDARASAIHDALAIHFANRSPDDVRIYSELVSGAAWHARQGDNAAAMLWLARAAELGFVMRELDLDPSFDSLRSMPGFNALRARMAQRAAEVRARLDDVTGQC